MKSFWLVFLTGLMLVVFAIFGIEQRVAGNLIDQMLVMLLGFGLMYCSSLMLRGGK